MFFYLFIQGHLIPLHQIDCVYSVYFFISIKITNKKVLKSLLFQSSLNKALPVNNFTDDIKLSQSNLGKV